jgi:outer membrane lipoprotein carrier protein
MLIRKLVFSGMFFLASLFSPENGDDVLKSVQDKFNSIESFSADFSESQSSIKGVFYFKKENQFKIKTGKQEITNNGSTIWNFDVSQNRVVINDVENESSSFSLRQYLFEYPEKCEVEISKSDSGEQYLKLTPVSDELGFSLAKIYIDDNYLVKKIILENGLAAGINLEFKNVKLDIELTDDFFNFSPPEGSRIIDLR